MDGDSKMKSKFLLTFLACFLLSFSFASGQSLTLESVDGLTDLGNLPTDAPVTFNLRVTNSSATQTGVTNGFRVYSSDGASWTTSVGTATPDIQSYFTMFSINPFSITGTEADTIGFGGIFFGVGGLPPDYSEVAYSITIGPIPAGDVGKTIALDSSYYRPAGVWKWAGAAATFPSWDGPHVYQIGDVASNTAPVLAAIGAQAVNEGELLTINISASDTDGDALTLTATPLPTGAEFTDNGDGTGVFTWTPEFNQAGTHDVTFGVSDGTDSVDELVTITVNNTNRAPMFVAALPNVEIDEGQQTSFYTAAIDLDLDPLTFSVFQLPDGATYVPYDEFAYEFIWTPGFEQAGVYEVIFAVSDGDLEIVDTVYITVNNVNRPPVLTAIGDKSVDEGVELSFATPVTDPDDSTFFIMSIDPLPAGASYHDIQDGTGIYAFIWTPTFDQAGEYVVTFKVDDSGLTDEETITITVNDVNQAPVLAEIGHQAVLAGDVLFFSVVATDPDGNFPILNATPLPDSAIFVDSGNGMGYFWWLTKIADSGTYDVTFSATDGFLTDDEFVTITVGEAPKMIVVDSNVFNFTFTEGETTSDTAFINITELNDAPITVDAIETSSWMDLSGFIPVVLPTQLKIAVYPNNLPIGNYSDTVWIFSPNADDSVEIVLFLSIVERPNTPAYLTTPIDSIYYIDECTQLDLNFVSIDDEGDQVSLSMIGIVENMTFADNGDGTADFNFSPNFSQEGYYNLAVNLFDGRDSSTYPFTIFVDSCSPGVEGNVLTMPTVPAVPGARLTVPVNYENDCDLWDANVSIKWASEYITLDSASINPGEFALWSHTITINNDSNFMILDAHWTEVQQSPTTGNMMNLYFSLEVGTPAGSYPLDFYMEPMFNRDCGTGQEEVRPQFNLGFINVDTSENYVCGYVVDPDGNPIPGATVELWDSFPVGTVQDAQDASGNGVFAFSGFMPIPFDLYAYHNGYYPGYDKNINFAQSGRMIVLTPMSDFVTPTNTWVDFFCGVNTFKGSPLPVGSVVEAYDPDGVKCGEFVVHTAGEYGFMHVYGDDEFTTEDEGANVGDVLRFYVNGIEAITGATPIWTEDRAIFEVCLDVPDVTPHTCMLTTGWNLVSWNVDTEVDDIANVLASLDDCIEVVMGFEQGALTYDATLPQFSDLWSVDHLSAYWIKVNCDIEITVLGTPVPSTTPIPVTTGWNLVSYLPEISMPTDFALTTIHNDLVVALGYENSAGLTYLPGQGEFNDLTTMNSCYGYWVKVNNNGTLIYPDNMADSVAGRKLFTNLSSSAGRIEATTSWMNIYAYDLKLDNAQVKAGAEIMAFNKDDKLVGSYVMKTNGQFGFMPIYGDDSQTEYVDGMISGDEFYLTIDGVETAEQFTWTTSGDKIEIKGLTAKTTSDVLPISFGLGQNYPNPFNPTTTINFDIPVSGQVKVEIFNLLGQSIATPFDEVAAAGQHVVTWDGRDDGGKSVASGIYFYRLTADNFTDTKKMTLLK